MSKVHLHDEQFDGWKHAACGRLDVPATSDRVVGDVEFEALSKDQRCRDCAAYWWPKGGEA